MMYLGGIIKPQDCGYTIPAHVCVETVAPGAYLADPRQSQARLRPDPRRLNRDSAAPVLPDPPGAQARSTRGSAGPRAGTVSARVVDWVARQPGPVTAMQVRAAVDLQTFNCAQLVARGMLVSRGYFPVTGALITQYTVRGRPWPPLPVGATLVRTAGQRVAP